MVGQAFDGPILIDEGAQTIHNWIWIQLLQSGIISHIGLLPDPVTPKFQTQFPLPRA